MTMTLQEVRARINLDELDYQELAADLGAAALPYLRELAAGPDPMLASKATYLASIIGGSQSEEILEQASQRAEPEVRVAAAAGLRNMAAAMAERVAERLLGDQDVGVRQTALRSLGEFRTPMLRERVREMAQRDPESFIRTLANRIMSGPP